MQRITVALATLLVMFSAAAAAADDTEALIALDKQWGESVVKGDTTVSAKILADKVVSVTESGVKGKQGTLAELKPAPAGTRYEPTDYKVTFINPDTAIMTHGTKGAITACTYGLARAARGRSSPTQRHQSRAGSSASLASAAGMKR